MTNEEGNAIVRVIFALTGTELVPSIDFNTAKKHCVSVSVSVSCNYLTGESQVQSCASVNDKKEKKVEVVVFTCYFQSTIVCDFLTNYPANLSF